MTAGGNELVEGEGAVLVGSEGRKRVGGGPSLVSEIGRGEGECTVIAVREQESWRVGLKGLLVSRTA